MKLIPTYVKSERKDKVIDRRTAPDNASSGAWFHKSSTELSSTKKIAFTNTFQTLVS